MKRYLLTICFSMCFMVSLVYAEPVINEVSGTFVDQEIITISGIGFGEKTTAEPLLFENFESGSKSSALYTETGVEMYNGSGQLSNSDYCLRLDKSTDSALDIRFNHTMNPGGDKLYTFINRRYDYDVSPDNHKFFRIWQTNRPESILWNYNWGIYPMRRSTSPRVDPNNPSPGENISLGYANYPKVGQWQTEEFFVETETAIGTYDGVMAYRLNNNQHRSWAENRPMFTEAYQQFAQIYIDNFSDRAVGGTPGDYIYVDNVYIDNTWARVVIGDSNVYDNCNHIEIQYPTSWSDNGDITIKFNQGSFQVGSTVFLFVFDKDNQISNTYQLEVGGEGVIQALPAPQNLQISNPS